MAFLPNVDDKPQINHIDGNKLNNNIHNLEWVTNGENQIHAYEHGLNYVTGKAGRPKIAVTQKTLSGDKVNSYASIGDASRCTGIARQNIEKVIHGTRKSAGNYVWEREVMPFDETV